MPLAKSNAGHAHTQRVGRKGRLPAAFQFQKWQTHFCIAIRIAMPWDAMSAKRNETKRNGMEQNDDRRHSTSACSLHNCLHLLHIFAFYFLLHSVHLTHSPSPPFLLSCSFVPLGGNCSNLRARPLSTKKGKQVTNKKRVKIKKIQQQENCTTDRDQRGVPGGRWRRGMWTLFFVLCLVQMFAIFCPPCVGSFVIYYYFLASAFKQIA